MERLNWGKLYKRLQGIVDSLKFPDETPNSFKEALGSARSAERAVTKKYVYFSSLLVDCKSELQRYKLLYKNRLKSLFADVEIGSVARTKSERMLYLEACLVEEQKDIDAAQDRYDRVKSYLDCLTRVLSDIKHHREDVNRKIVLMSSTEGGV